jgi:D-glucuronyl C5-epimerase C-terminus
MAPSLDEVFRRPSVALALTVLTTALGPAHDAPRGHAASVRGPSVSRALAALQRSGAIDEETYKRDYGAYVAAKRSLAHLSGTRRTELGAVLANLQAMAAAGRLTPSRLPVLFLTLERNRSWWTTEPLLGADERVTFPDSKLVWEYYPGQGIEIQWLATFGKANGYFNSGHENGNMRQLLDEAIPLATRRAGGIAWEYLFSFDGGSPPWTSGLSQGTALQALSRAYQRFKDPEYLRAAQQALGIFRVAPSTGVRVPTRAGVEYAEYTYAPKDLILNGFIQALVGLYEYTAITKDPVGLSLFEAGDAEARAEVPRYDTGAWSMYDQFGESDLNYHELLTEFLQHLCERTRKGPPVGSEAPPSTTPAPGGAVAAARAAATPIPGDEIYCTTAQRFSDDLKTPPRIALLSTRLKAGVRAGVTISLSKISTVTLSVRKGAKVVWTNRATVEGGRPKLLWPTPKASGTFSVTLTATDLAGNFATAQGTIALTRK